jgi:type VI secretion system protein ImpH
VSFRDDLAQEPWRFDFYATLRRLERSHETRPRIGDAPSRRDEYVLLGQDPYLDFPASNLAKAEADERGRTHIRVKFLGMLGPNGALPLATTEEAYGWLLARDDAFPRFLDLFSHRFLQLFYRAWADARPAAQHDRPDADRFKDYVGSALGIGSEPYRDRDSVPDVAKLGFAGLLAPQAKSASRLANLIRGMFGVEAEVEQFVPSRLVFEVNDRTRLGGRNATLGEDALLGGSVFSVQDKFRIRITTASLAEYRRFLPTGDRSKPLADLVFLFNGEQLDWDVELALPARAAEPVRLSRSGQLGWTGWLAPREARDGEVRCDARFRPGAPRRA